MATPADNLDACARSLQSLTSIMSAFGSEISKLISAVGKTKSNAGGGGRGGKGGGGDSDPEVTREIEANIKETRKNNKKLLDTQLSDADRENKESLRFARAQQADANAVSAAASSLDAQRSREILANEDAIAAAARSLNAQRSRALLANDGATAAAARSLDAQRSAAILADENAIVNAVASLNAQRSRALLANDEATAAAARSLDAQRSRALLANDEATAAAARSLDAQRSRAILANEDAYQRASNAAADAAATAKERRSRGLQEQRSRSQGERSRVARDFSGARSFDPREFLNSLRGGLVSGVANATTQGFSAFQRTRQNVSNATGGGGAPGGNIASAMAGPIAAIGTIVGVVGALTTAFMALIEMVGKFVGALDPALMQQLGLAFENLSAVIGIGLRPIVSAAVLAIKAFGDILVPVMKQLEPVMIKLSMVLLNAVIPSLLIWGYELELLIPVIESLIPILFAFGDIIMVSAKILIPQLQILAGALLIVISIFNLVVSVVYLLLAAFYAASGELKSWVPGKGKAAEADKDMAKNMENRAMGAARESVQGGAKGIGLMLEGAKGYVPGSGDPNKRERAKPGGAEGAAAKGASYSGVADLGKNMMQAAFGSSSQNVESQQLAQQKEMNAGIDRIGGILFGWERPKEAAAGVRR